MAHNPRLDLDLVDESFREEGADGTVHHPHGEHFLLVRSAFTLAESAGELARRGQLLAVIALEWEEVDSRSGVRPDAGGQDGGIGVTRHDGARREPGDTTGFEPHDATADLSFNEGDWHNCLSV